MSTSQPPVPCPNCGAPTTGKFCTLCGEAMPAALPGGCGSAAGMEYAPYRSDIEKALGAGDSQAQR